MKHDHFVFKGDKDRRWNVPVTIPKVGSIPGQLASEIEHAYKTFTMKRILSRGHNELAAFVQLMTEYEEFVDGHSACCDIFWAQAPRFSIEKDRAAMSTLTCGYMELIVVPK